MVAGSRHQWVSGPFRFYLFPIYGFCLTSVDGQWITARKDWKEAKRQHKMRKGQTDESRSHDSTPPAESGKDQGLYEKNMDTMRCILYLHGGEYRYLILGVLAYSSIRWLLLWKCRPREVLCRFHDINRS